MFVLVTILKFLIYCGLYCHLKKLIFVTSFILTFFTKKKQQQQTKSFRPQWHSIHHRRSGCSISMVFFSFLSPLSVVSPMMTKSKWQLFLLSPSSTLYPFSLFMLYQNNNALPRRLISIEYKVVACLVAKSSPTLCDPLDCSPPGSSVHGISQARILEWVAISFSRGSSWPREWTHISCIGRRIPYCRVAPKLMTEVHCFNDSWNSRS